MFGFDVTLNEYLADQVVVYYFQSYYYAVIDGESAVKRWMAFFHDEKSHAFFMR